MATTRKKRITRKSAPGMRYNMVGVPKNFPPGYHNAKVVKVVKSKGKAQIVVTIQVERRINL